MKKLLLIAALFLPMDLAIAVRYSNNKAIDNSASGNFASKYYAGDKKPCKKKKHVVYAKPKKLKAVATPVAAAKPAPALAPKPAPVQVVHKKTPSDNRSSAIRKKDWYVRLFAGYSKTKLKGDKDGIDDAENTPMGGAAIGKHLTENLRMDVEANHKLKFQGSKITATTTQHQDFESYTFLANVYGEYPIEYYDKLITPFIMGGVGCSINKSGDYIVTNSLFKGSNSIPGKTKTDFAWQIGLGLSFPVSKYLDIDASIRYIDRGLAEANDSSEKIKTRITDRAAITSLKINL